MRIKEGNEWKAAFTMYIGAYKLTVIYFGLTNSLMWLSTTLSFIIRSCWIWIGIQMKHRQWWLWGTGRPAFILNFFWGLKLGTRFWLYLLQRVSKSCSQILEDQRQCFIGITKHFNRVIIIISVIIFIATCPRQPMILIQENWLTQFRWAPEIQVKLKPGCS